jgi:ABC-type amino acid transport system permease subunit
VHVHRIQYRSEGGIAEKHTSERGDIEYMNDYNYWLLMIATLGLASQLSQLPKHIDPARNTLFQELSILQEKVSNVLGANPVPQLEDAMKVNFDQAALTNLSWHARMVFAPMWNTLLAGVLYSLVGIQTLEHFASTIGSEECTESVMGVLLMMPASVFETMWIGMAGFILAAVFNLRLSLTHFEALTNGYVAFFRGTPSVKMLKLAMEKAGRGAQTFSNDRMRLAYLTNLTVQILLLLIINYVVSESKDGEGLDLVGSLIFGILVFERFLVGFQMALLAAYVRHSVELDDDSDDVGLLEIKKRERISWHSSMIFYTGFLAVLQSLICLPGIFTVIPFFSVAEVGDDGSFIDCSRLDMSLGAKISGATSDELQFFFICLLCMFVAFACQIWLTRTHFVQFWRYEKDVVFTHSVEEDEEEEDKAKRSAKQEIWRQQRLLMVRIGRMRATQLGDDEVITRLIDHFALTAQAPGQGLTEMDVRIAVSSQLEEVFRDWKEKFEVSQPPPLPPPATATEQPLPLPQKAAPLACRLFPLLACEPQSHWSIEHSVSLVYSHLL